MKRWPAAVVHAVVFLAVAVAHAEEPGPFVVIDMCATCHGPNGDSPGSIPKLSSLNAEVMRAFLYGYRAGDIESTVMTRIAKALTDAEIEALARYFAGTKE